MLFAIDSAFELQESWLNQVKEMQMHCDQGLNHVQSTAAFGSQTGETQNDSRLGSKLYFRPFSCYKVIVIVTCTGIHFAYLHLYFDLNFNLDPMLLKASLGFLSFH